MEKAKGKIIHRKSGGRGYKSAWIYIPSQIKNDSSFPFSDKEDIMIEIKDGTLVISKRDKLFEIIEKYGIENATLPKLLEKKAIKNKDLPFLYFKEEIYSYQDLNSISNRIAHGLLGIIKEIKSRKPKITVLLPNCPNYLFCWFGILKAGAIFVSVDVQFQEDLLKYVLINSNTEIIIIDYLYLNKYEKIIDSLVKIKKVLIINAPENFNYKYKYKNFENIYTSNIHNPDVVVKNWHPMSIIYTAGTTGKPKGVLFRHYFVLTGINVGKELTDLGLNRSQKIFCPIPFYHSIAQLITMFSTIFYDASIVISDHFNPLTFWEEIIKHKAEIFCYYGDYLSKLISQPPKDSEKNHTIKWAFGIGISKTNWDIFEKRFGISLHELWSLNEGAGLTINKVGSKGGKMGSVGTSINGVELKIVDESNNILPAGPENIGEIQVRHTLPISLEYYNLSVNSITKEGNNRWIYTGDMGYKDKDGFIYYVGRKNDLIKKQEKVIFPNKIEEIVNLNPNIVESAVFGVQSERNNDGDEDIKICAVITDSKNFSHEDLFNYLYKKLPISEMPRFIEFKKELPKSTNLMVQKFLLKEEWKDENVKKNTWDSKKKSMIRKY